MLTSCLSTMLLRDAALLCECADCLQCNIFEVYRDCLDSLVLLLKGKFTDFLLCREVNLTPGP